MLFNRLLAAAALVLASTASLAAAELIHATPEMAQFANAMRRTGYSAEVKTAANGPARIRSMIVGKPFSVATAGCRANRSCDVINYVISSLAPGAMTSQAVSEFNLTSIAANLALTEVDGKKVFILRTTVMIQGGITEDLLEGSLNLWRMDVSKLLKSFSRP
jgi:hypothetical protein